MLVSKVPPGTGWIWSGGLAHAEKGRVGLVRTWSEVARVRFKSFITSWLGKL